MNKQTHVRFDWAVKRLLRDKANFGILEGFLSELLKEDIKIHRILESESNTDFKEGKYNQVDLLVENQKGELIIIEIQNSSEVDYFHRTIFGISKAVTEHIKQGDNYSEIKKIISVNIVYFDIGHGEDYLYKGTTNFVGIHNNDVLLLSENQKKLFKREKVSDIYPEIYLIKVNNFNDLAKDTLDEWIYFFKNSEIKKEFNAKGIKQADKRLHIMNLDENDRREYNRYVKYTMYEASMVMGNVAVGKLEGIKEGRKEGIKEGIKEGNLTTAKKMKVDGLPIEDIIKYTGLSEQEILNL